MRPGSKQYFSIALLGTLLGAAPLAAQQDASITDTTFQKLDADGSGTVSKGELTSFPSLARHFESADADGDGQLSVDEFRGLLASSHKESGVE